MNVRSLNRWQAFGLHLLISLMILVFLLLVIYLAWYPQELIHFGGWQGMKIVAAVDLILGPLITLIVFNPLKKELKLDMAIIAIIQICALSYGCWTVRSERPLLQILSNDGLHIISANTLAYHNITSNQLAELSEQQSPPFSFYLDLPTNSQQINQIRFLTEFTAKTPLSLRTDLYREYQTELTSDLIPYLKAFPQPKAHPGCYRIPIISKHLEGQYACLFIESGKYRIDG